MFTIIFSNRYQELLEQLLDAASAPPASPFAAECIVIPSAAIQRNIELAMADRLGVCANVQFSYLGVWVWQQMAKISPVPDTSPFSPDTLAWRIFRILENPIFVGTHRRLHAWLEKADAVMRYELASQVSSLLEQMMTYRPDLVEAWSTNKLICMPGGTRVTAQDQQWQAELWRRILQETGSGHHLSALLKKLDAPGATDIDKLRRTGTTHLFCPPSIAPLYLDILNRLGQWMDLRLYILNPCREYWFDIVDRKRLSHLAAEGRRDFHESGNHLLSSWGKQTRAMIDLLFEHALPTVDEQSSFMSNAERGKSTLLARLQDAILDLRDLPPAVQALDTDDRSIEIHVCHSLGRELEVLQDQLLSMLAAPNPPRPDEILIVTPDLEQAAPLIEAIFGTASDDRHIPHLITGLGNSRINPVARALIELLTLASSRFAASAVFNLLQCPVVAQNFGLGETDLELIHRWMGEAGIRWGIDADHRRRLDLPDGDRYSFDDGLQRLFLGYALPSGDGTPFHSRLPAGEIEGTDAATLGSFVHFVRQLESLQRGAMQAKTPQEWRTALLAWLDIFVSSAGNLIDDHREVRNRISGLCNDMQDGYGDHPLSLEVIRHALSSSLDDPARGGVPTGRVTFTSMSSLRNLPYRVICAIGLNDGIFPTAKRPAEFDLIALSPRRGDRQRSLDERNLFLDLLLAAQDRLYLSYTGHSVRDNSEMPPSVLIADLLDYLGENIRNRVMVVHPLQPFSPDYFSSNDARIASSNAEYYRALTAKREQPAGTFAADDPRNETTDDDSVRDTSEAFFSSTLAIPDAEWRQPTLDQLIRFFHNPSRYLLRLRLGMSFPDRKDDLEDDEPFLPDSEARSALADRLLPLHLQGASRKHILETALAGPEFPPSEMGLSLLRQEMQAIEIYADGLSQALDSPCLPPFARTLSFAICGEDWGLSGTFGDLRVSGLIRYRYADLSPRDRITAWISHLFLNAVAPDGVSCCTSWHARDAVYVLPPIDDAHAQLAKLLELYRTGLSRPLRFFPRTAWEYISNGRNRFQAANTWSNRDGRFGESLDPSYRQAMRGTVDPLDDEFTACADLLFGRMSVLLEEVSS